MDESAKVISRGWLAMLVGTALLAAGLVVLCLPVYLDAHDRWGIQIKCGNGYYTQLLQASISDQEPAQQSRPATNYLDQCKSALLHRRAWAIPLTAAGTLIVIGEMAAWMRGGSPSVPEPGSAEPAGPPPAALPEEEFHEAAVLDRRYRAHRPPAHDTTL
ncbi:hypothetical protein [Mycobacterium kyorinense]|uniref:Transmembrane protein n=1 Tax=Mycobacterium kyorinense TaxID=487514 RepID=A0A1X1XJQ7_9MYCO|nr:hypothetical protein [Mycobacterium kyorinense]ORV99019.1 hypothetical protein AWC14_12390 [Mycobacterium kyorinense]